MTDTNTINATTATLARDILAKGNVELIGARKVLAEAICKVGLKRLPTDTAREARLIRANEKARASALDLGASADQADAAGDAAEAETARRMGETARGVGLASAAVRIAVGSL